MIRLAHMSFPPRLTLPAGAPRVSAWKVETSLAPKGSDHVAKVARGADLLAGAERYDRLHLVTAPAPSGERVN